MMPNRQLPDRVYGVDWSGARDAGRHIWIAAGERGAKHAMLTGLSCGAELPGSGPALEQCLPAFEEWIATRGACAIGFDFPFSLPRTLMRGESWQSFMMHVGERFASAEAFRAWCYARAGGRELRRRTDKMAKTPFCAYNLRMYRQTYWGMSGLLAPLVKRGAAVALPMQPIRADVPCLLETCPASVLKVLGLYRPYKGAGRDDARKRIVQALLDMGLLRVDTARLAAIMYRDAGGDALDATLAMLTTARALNQADFPYPDWHEDYAIEAFVYTGYRQTARECQNLDAHTCDLRIAAPYGLICASKT